MVGYLPLGSNRAVEYRRRAEEIRTKADAIVDENHRKQLLEVAETWDRMADYEEKKFSPPSNQATGPPRLGVLPSPPVASHNA